jgi:hypothetical protein
MWSTPSFSNAAPSYWVCKHKSQTTCKISASHGY